MSDREAWERRLSTIALGGRAPRRQSKYHNEPTVIDGHTFPSKREANRYGELKAMQDRGEIIKLELQPKFPLHVTRPDGVKVEIGSYRADFRYVVMSVSGLACGVVEDAKGMKTESYQLRKRHVEAEYNIEIVEV